MDIDEVFKAHEQVMAVFLDISNAFNEVNSDVLLQKLAVIRYSANFIRFVKFLTYKRHVYSKYNLNEPKPC